MAQLEPMAFYTPPTSESPSVAPEQPKQPTSKFQMLPVEIRQNILMELDSFPLLFSAIRACRGLYDAFRGAKAIILAHLLISLIGIDVMPVALAVNSIHQQPHLTGEDIQHYFDRYFRQKVPVSLRLFATYDLKQLSGMAKLSTTIQAFTEDLASRRPWAEKEPIRPTERARILRSFYLFEIYCCLFGVHEATYRRQFSLFFAPWELEQLCCIYDFLIYKLFPGKWHPMSAEPPPQLPGGEMYLNSRDRRACKILANGEYFHVCGDRQAKRRPNVRGFLSYGLVELRRRIARTTDGEAIHKPSHQIPKGSKVPDTSYNYFYTPEIVGYAALRTPRVAHPRAGHGDVWYQGMPLKDERPPVPFRPSTAQKGKDDENDDGDDDGFRLRFDSGPREAWEWAYADRRVVDKATRRNRAELRDWGYVFWDRERLDLAGLFRKPFVPPYPNCGQIELGQPGGASVAQYERMQERYRLAASDLPRRVPDWRAMAFQYSGRF